MQLLNSSPDIAKIQTNTTSYSVQVSVFNLLKTETFRRLRKRYVGQQMIPWWTTKICVHLESSASLFEFPYSALRSGEKEKIFLWVDNISPHLVLSYRFWKPNAAT